MSISNICKKFLTENVFNILVLSLSIYMFYKIMFIHPFISKIVVTNFILRIICGIVAEIHYGVVNMFLI